MIDGTVLQNFTEWVASNWVASAIAGGITWDVIKENMLEPFKEKFIKFFKNEQQTEKYLKNLCSSNAVNQSKPYRDAEDVYEELTKNKIPEEFLIELRQFVIDNKEIIDKMNFKATTVFNIKEQHAGRDINNINGSQIIINN